MILPLLTEPYLKQKNRDLIYDAIELPDYDEIKENKRSFAQSFYKQYCNTDPFSGKRLFEPYGGTTFVVQNPPAKPLTQTEMDEVYALPYMRNYHPSYEKDGGVPAIREIKFSPDQQPRMFWRMQFLCADVSSGQNYSDEKPRVDH